MFRYDAAQRLHRQNHANDDSRNNLIESTPNTASPRHYQPEVVITQIRQVDGSANSAPCASRRDVDSLAPYAAVSKNESYVVALNHSKV